MIRTKSLLAGLALSAAAAANAAPSLSFLIDGDTFTQPFRIENDSTAGEFVTRFQLNLSTIAVGTFCFDTAQNSVCNGSNNNGVAFSPVGGTAASTGLVGPVVVADGATLLDISFTDFAAGEFFTWDIDIDEVGAGNQQTVTGNELIGATATVDFSDGVRLFGVIAAVPGNADAGQFQVTGRGSVVPLPGTLLLAGLAMLGLGMTRRRG